MYKLPETGFLSLRQIIGQEAITEEQAERNRQRCKGPKRPRPAIAPIIPVKKSCWWHGVGDGRFPKPVKLGKGRGAFWKVEDIKKLIASAGMQQ